MSAGWCGQALAGSYRRRRTVMQMLTAVLYTVACRDDRRWSARRNSTVAAALHPRWMASHTSGSGCSQELTAGGAGAAHADCDSFPATPAAAPREPATAASNMKPQRWEHPPGVQG